MTSETAPPTDAHDQRVIQRRMTTTSSGSVPALRVVLLAGLAAAVAVAVLGYGGWGLFSQEVAIVALGIGLATVSAVLFFLLLALRATNKSVQEIVHMHDERLVDAQQQATRHSGPEVEVFPRINDTDHVIRVRGVDDASATLLNRAGVYTLADLRLADPVAVASQTGLPVERVQVWCGEAELMRVPGIGPAEAALLVHHGIRSVEELAHADPRRMTHLLASRGPVRQVQVQKRAIDADLVGHWIDNARSELEQPMTLNTTRTLR